MQKTLVAIAAAALAATFATSAAAGERANSSTLDGIRIANGSTLDGIRILNGLSFNGLSFNGLSFNGLSFNGLSFNGAAQQGAKPAIAACAAKPAQPCMAPGLRVTAVILPGQAAAQAR